MKPTNWALGAFALIALAHCNTPPPKQADAPDPGAPGATSEAAGGAGATSGSSGGSGSGSSSSGGDPLAAVGAPKGSSGPQPKGEPGQAASLATMLEGLKWGITPEAMTKDFTKVGGIIWKDYDKQLMKASGPQVQAIEQERQHAADAVDRNYIPFDGSRPIALDSTGLRSEFSYKNGEGLVYVERPTGKTYYFFFGVDKDNPQNKKNGRLWKIYREYKLGADGVMGKDFLTAVNKLGAQFGVMGRVQPANPEQGLPFTTVDWADPQGNHLRAVDRTPEGFVGVVTEEMSTFKNLAALRPNKLVDPTEMDPTVSAVSGGHNRVDPNAARTAPSASASGKKGQPAPKTAPPKK